MGPAWLWLLGALASAHCQPFAVHGAPWPCCLSGLEPTPPRGFLEGLGFNLTDTPPAHVHRGFQTLLYTLGLPSPKRELKVGSSLFLDKTLKPQRRFLDDIRMLYGALAFSANFTDPAATARQIDDHVRKRTYGQVTASLQQLAEDTHMVLTNFLFFKAKWKRPFHRYQTQKEEGVFVDGRPPLHIPLMHQKETHGLLYDPDLACTVLQTEHSGGTAVLLVLPDPGRMQQVEAALQPETLRSWGLRLTPSLLDLHLPRVSISGTYNLEGVLSRLGLGHIFSSEADFAGVTGQSNQRLSRMSHRAAVSMSEWGTKAGAASGLLPQLRPPNATWAPHAHFNRPFLVLVWELTTQSLLFLGKVASPAAG